MVTYTVKYKLSEAKKEALESKFWFPGSQHDSEECKDTTWALDPPVRILVLNREFCDQRVL